MLEAVDGAGLKKLVMESLVAILLTCIDFQAFLGLTAGAVAVGSQSTRLVDATVVVVIAVFHIHHTFPFLTFLIVVSGMVWVEGVEVNARDHDALFIAKQVEGIGAKRNGRQSMSVAAQRLYEITVGGHLAYAAVVFVEHGGADDDAMLDGIGKVE